MYGLGAACGWCLCNSTGSLGGFQKPDAIYTAAQDVCAAPHSATNITGTLSLSPPHQVQRVHACCFQQAGDNASAAASGGPWPGHAARLLSKLCKVDRVVNDSWMRTRTNTGSTPASERVRGGRQYASIEQQAAEG